MLPRIDFGQIEFSDPQYLRLLVIPALLLVLWVWRLVSRRADTHSLNRSRLLPVRERFALAGDLPFWLCLVAAISCAIVALARPHGPARALRLGGVDLVILADGSASMRVKDLPGGDRWQRAMRFVRTLGDSLAWDDDRVALTVFARIATPQVRLTKDPNTFFFFLDHLDRSPPFRIEDNTTWDTNLELGLYWGLRLMERDEELHGKSSNAKVFVLLTDGQAWSGEIAKSLRLAARRQIPIFTVGIGTLSGGQLPIVPERGNAESDEEAQEVLSSHLDRESLQRIAQVTGGQYFEIGRDSDRRIANAVIDAGRRLAPTLGVEETAEELYWWFLNAAAGFTLLGMLFLRHRAELLLQLTGAVAIFIVVSRLME
jgi:Ca-activated chloride channel family protein